MDLAHPITVIVPSLAARVLEVLAGTTRPLSGREIHRLARYGSHSGVYKALLRLEDQGIVAADERDAGTFFVANREHLAWPAIEDLVGLRTVLRKRLTAEIELWDVAPIHASIFGSVARGEADIESDVDLLLVRPETLDAEGEATWDAQLSRLRDRVRALTGNRAQTFVLTPSRLSKHIQSEDPIVRNWLHDSVVLVGPPLRELIAGLPR